MVCTKEDFSRWTVPLPPLYLGIILKLVKQKGRIFLEENASITPVTKTWKEKKSLGSGRLLYSMVWRCTCRFCVVDTAVAFFPEDCNCCNWHDKFNNIISVMHCCATFWRKNVLYTRVCRVNMLCFWIKCYFVIHTKCKYSRVKKIKSRELWKACDLVGFRGSSFSVHWLI